MALQSSGGSRFLRSLRSHKSLEITPAEILVGYAYDEIPWFLAAPLKSLLLLMIVRVNELLRPLHILSE